MKMKLVCEKTELTEKAIRLYIAQGLIHPTVTEGLHKASYDFSEEDVAQLRIIAALRAADFGLADIREMQAHPEQLPQILEEHKILLEEDIERKRILAEALGRISPADSGNLEAIANSIPPQNRTGKIEKGSAMLLPILIVAGIVLYLVASALQDMARNGLVLGLSFFGMLLGGVMMFMAVRYAACTSRARKLPNHAVGKIVAVSRQTGFDGGFAMGSTATVGAPRWGGSGGLWTFFFLLWNELRPDHWVPVVQFEDQNGKLQSGMFPYGGLQNSFQEGDTVEISWGKYPSRVFPQNAPWLRRKGLIYGSIGIILFGVCLFGFGYALTHLDISL